MPSLPRYLIRALRDSFLLIVIVAFPIVGFERFLGGDGPVSARIVPSILVYYWLFQTIVSRHARPWTLRQRANDETQLSGQSGIWRFIGLSLIFLVVLVGPPVVFAVWLDPQGPNARAVLHGAVLLAMLPWSGLLLALFGTMFPAAAMGRPMAPRDALRAARKTWWKVLLQLSLIPLPLLAAFLWLIATYLPYESRLAPSPVLDFAQAVVEYIVYSLPQVLSVAILCRAYELAYPAPPLGETPIPQPDPVTGSLVIHAPLGTPEA